MNIAENINSLLSDIKDYYAHKKVLDHEYSYMRCVSLDFMRGILVVFSILCISVGLRDSVPTFLNISKWNGMNIADLITPFFILVMGSSIPFYIKKRMSDFDPKVELIKKASIRFMIYLIIGLIYSAVFLDYGNIRLTGPIQMIAVSYIFTFLVCIALLSLNLKSRAIISILISCGILFSLVMSLISFKSGISVDKNTFVLLDRRLISSFMNSSMVDPEGILTSISSISIGLIGASLGVILNKKNSNKKYRRIRRRLLFRGENKNLSTFFNDVLQWISPKSISSILSNYNRFNLDLKRIVDMFIICLLTFLLASIFKIFIPVNRSVLSLSFVMYASSLYFLIMMVFYILCDVIGIKFFVSLISRMGKNSLLIIWVTTLVEWCINLIKLKSIYTGQYLPFNEWFTTDFILPFLGIEYASFVYSILIVLMVLIFVNVLEKYDIKLNI